MLAKKFVGVLNIDPVRGKRRGRKVFEILCHHDIAAPDDSRSENMTVVRIGEDQGRDS
jgi:hypothetical protein